MEHAFDSLLQLTLRHIHGILILILMLLINPICNGFFLGIKGITVIEIPCHFSFIQTANVFHTIQIVLVERLSDVRNHCPIQMRSADTAKLLKALKLRDNCDKLKGCIDTPCRANIRLPCVKSICQKVIIRNAHAVMISNGIGRKIVSVDFVIEMIPASHIGHTEIESVLAHHLVCSLSDTPTEGALIHVCVLILNVQCLNLWLQ